MLMLCLQVGFVYFLINYALFLQRFMLTLHVTEHRRLFKRGKLQWHTSACN
jgi:hypothetical protein